VQVSATCAFLRLEVILTEDTTVLKKNPTSDTLADAGTSVDVGDQIQASQHGFIPQKSLGLVRLRRKSAQKALDIEEGKRAKH
jgi:hypothetical protein